MNLSRSYNRNLANTSFKKLNYSTAYYFLKTINHSPNKNIMFHIFLHKEIRNDNHCPECRKHYISAHEKFNDAYDNETYKIYDLDLENEAKFKKGEPIWINEWVRRRNGDKYHIVSPLLGKVYNLQNFDVTKYEESDTEDDTEDDTDDDAENNTDIDTDKKTNEYSIASSTECSQNILITKSDINKSIDTSIDNIKLHESKTIDNVLGYMLVYIIVDKEQECPYNIKYLVTFHSTLEDVCSDIVNILKKFYRKHSLSNSNNEALWDKIKQFEPIWLKDTETIDKTGKLKMSINGRHLQIVKLESGKKICINDLCSQIQPNQW